MLASKKTKAQLIEELAALTAHVERLEAAESKQTERSLVDWIQRYELVVAASGQIAYEYEVATGDILWGATIEKVLGYSMKEISGGFQQWIELLHPDDREATLTYLGQAEAACSYWDAEYRMRHKEGRYVWIRDRGFFVADASGRAARQLGVLEDITERKAADEALAASRERAAFLADLLERSSQPFGAGYPDGRMGLCNTAFLRLVGYSREEFASVDWARDLTPAEWLEVERAKLEELHRTGQPVRYEKEYIRKDGSRVPIDLLAHLVRDEHGQPKHYYAFVTDISERKRAEDALRTSESFLRSVIEQNPCAMWISDDKGNLLRLNQACRDLFHISDEEMVGKYNIFHDNIVEEAGLMPLVRRVFEEGESARFELEYDSARLSALPLQRTAAVMLETTIFPVRDASGRITNAVIQHLDITKRKAAETALRESERQLESVARFPMENPHPVLRVGQDGVVLFANAAAAALLEAAGSGVGQPAPADWRPWESWAASEPESRTIEVASAGRVFSFHLVAIPGRDYVNVYGRDITERKRAEKALQVSEARYRALVEQIPTVTYTATIDKTSTTTYVSPQIESLIGYTPSEYAADPAIWEKALHHDDRERVLAEVARTHASGEPFASEYRMVTRDGRVVWVRDEGAIVRDLDGRPVCLQGVMSDITAHKLAEEALRESEERFREVVENISEVLWLTDWTERELLYVSPSYETVYGRSRESLYRDRRSWIEAIHPEDRARIDATFAEKGEKGEYTEEEYRIVRPGGEVRWVRDRSFPVFNDQAQVHRWVGVAEDITERKLAGEVLQRAHDELEQRVRERTAELTAMNQRLQEEVQHRELTQMALRENRDLLRAVMDGINDVIFTKDRGGRYCLVNAAITDFVGKEPEEVIGKTSAALFSPEEARRREDEDRIVMQTKTPVHRELTVPIHGRPRSFLLSKMPHVDSYGQVVGIIGVARDVTEFKQAQDRLRRAERLASIGTLAAGIAHEINNPVGAVFLAAQNALAYLQEDGHRQDLVKCLNDILEDAARCGQIVRNLLRFAKEEPLEKEPAEITVVLTRAVDITRPLAEERGVTIELTLPSDSPRVLLNSTAILQALENVIRNGIQASERGDRVAVGLECEENYVRLIVRDFGHGLTEEQQAHMFDPFYTSRRAEGGSGLGLSIVHGVVEDHGGAVHVESNPGRGARVTLTLPTCP